MSVTFCSCGSYYILNNNIIIIQCKAWMHIIVSFHLISSQHNYKLVFAPELQLVSIKNIEHLDIM